MPDHIPFQPAKQKLTIASVDLMHTPNDLVVSAQYNPKELQLTETRGWAEHQSTTGQPVDGILEFGGVKPSTMQIELLFDGAENGGKIRGGRGQDPYVAEMIAKLQQLAEVRDPDSPLEEMRRPHYCIVTWGEKQHVRPFRCVIESLVIKYTMFSSDGVVLRASVTVSLKSADRVQLAKARRNQRVA